ncbi:MAG: hypothetical protein LBH79_03290 [Nitrososphaerota archaeon]|jgi:hypothetical protein|nr:hypothetical protein [Nitrososphaerota archaeon]
MAKIRWVILAFSLILTTCLIGGVIANLFAGDETSDLNTPSNPLDLVLSDDEELFTCHTGSEYEFAFPVKVDLSDGMNAAEAEAVARSLYETTMNQTNYEVKEVKSNSDDTWTVFLLWGSVSPDGYVEGHNHYYNVHVNAADKTVRYDRCY